MPEGLGAAIGSFPEAIGVGLGSFLDMGVNETSQVFDSIAETGRSLWGEQEMNFQQFFLSELVTSAASFVPVEQRRRKRSLSPVDLSEFPPKELVRLSSLPHTSRANLSPSPSVNSLRRQGAASVE